MLPMRKNFRAFFRRKLLLITNSSRNLLAALELLNLKVKLLTLSKINHLSVSCDGKCMIYARRLLESLIIFLGCLIIYTKQSMNKSCCF